jgi:hypothetical protein
MQTPSAGYRSAVRCGVLFSDRTRLMPRFFAPMHTPAPVRLRHEVFGTSPVAANRFAASFLQQVPSAQLQALIALPCAAGIQVCKKIRAIDRWRGFLIPPGTRARGPGSDSINAFA